MTTKKHDDGTESRASTHIEVATEIVNGWCGIVAAKASPAERLVNASFSPQTEILRDRIVEALQNAFDLGWKASGGAMLSEQPKGYIEVAFNRDEVAVIDAVLSIAPNRTPTTESIREKIGMFT